MTLAFGPQHNLRVADAVAALYCLSCDTFNMTAALGYQKRAETLGASRHATPQMAPQLGDTLISRPDHKGRSATLAVIYWCTGSVAAVAPHSLRPIIEIAVIHLISTVLAFGRLPARANSPSAVTSVRPSANAIARCNVPKVGSELSISVNHC